MARKDRQDRLNTVWDETLDGDYGSPANVPTDPTFSVVGRAFKYSGPGVRIAEDDPRGDWAGVFIRDNGQGGILPESMMQDISNRQKDGDEVSVMLDGQITYAIAASAISAGDFVSPTTNGAWQTEPDIPATDVASTRSGLQDVRRRGVRAKARTAATAAGDRFTLILY